MRFLLAALTLILSLASCAQRTSGSKSGSRKILVAGSMGVSATGALIGLNSLWYADYPRGGFRFFNDNNEWLQVDKAGHFFSAYQLAAAGDETFRWAGFSERTSRYGGSAMGLLFLTGVEILDGRSRQWGFSWGDQVANVSGYLSYVAQQIAWGEQRIAFRFSYSHTPFASRNPSLLGRNFQQRLLKDYNGQTYWCSINIHSFLASGATFPKWMNLAIGYGATGMTHAEMNEIDVNNFQRTREYYFSFDADLNRVKWPKKWMKITARVISFIKLPAPALEVQSDGKVKVHALFF